MAATATITPLNTQKPVIKLQFTCILQCDFESMRTSKKSTKFLKQFEFRQEGERTSVDVIGNSKNARATYLKIRTSLVLCI